MKEKDIKFATMKDLDEKINLFNILIFWKIIENNKKFF